MNLQQRSEFVKKTASALGFEQCGIAVAAFMEDDARRLETWLQQGYHGKMQYMENHFELRTDPRKLVPGARSVITLLFNYFPEEVQQENAPRVSKYAYGADYHEVIRPRLHEFLFRLQEELGEIHGRGFVDSAPVLERSWAVRSGLGWVGKNGNLIHPRKGSFFFLATLITDLALQADEAFATDHCGTCTRCIDACPTDAILPGKTIDGSRCISYFTIELRDALLPNDMKGRFENNMFGCDICQDVCPWNRFSTPHDHASLTPIPQVLDFSKADWERLTEDAFKKIFGKSPLKRTKYSGIMRNIHFLKD